MLAVSTGKGKKLREDKAQSTKPGWRVQALAQEEEKQRHHISLFHLSQHTTSPTLSCGPAAPAHPISAGSLGRQALPKLPSRPRLPLGLTQINTQDHPSSQGKTQSSTAQGTRMCLGKPCWLRVLPRRGQSSRSPRSSAWADGGAPAGGMRAPAPWDSTRTQTPSWHQHLHFIGALMGFFSKLL